MKVATVKKVSPIASLPDNDSGHCDPTGRGKLSITKSYTLLIPCIVLALYCLCLTGCTGGMDTSAKPPPRLYKITSKDLHGVDTYGTDHIWLVGHGDASTTPLTVGRPGNPRQAAPKTS